MKMMKVMIRRLSMKTEKISAGGVRVNMQFIIFDKGDPRFGINTKRAILISAFERSKEIVHGFWANAHRSISDSSYRTLVRADAEPFKGEMCPVSLGMENGYHLYAWSPYIENTCFLCRKDRLAEDLYSFLMNKFALPLVREWSELLLEKLEQLRFIAIGHSITGLLDNELDEISINLKENGGDTLLSELEVVRTVDDFSADDVMRALKELYKEGKIRLSDKPQKPFTVTELDPYLLEYGQSVVDNMKKVVKPLTTLKGTIDNVALKRLRLYPQQVAIVNGVRAALKKHKFVFMNEGMGTGKTVQSITAVDAIENQKYMDSHPGSNLKDVFASKDNVSYRVIVMPPVHLVRKWAAEIQNNIPYAKVYILEKFEDVVAIKARGKKAKGKEFYVLGKDFCKLSYSMRPVPKKIAKRAVGKIVCANCGLEKVYKGKEAPCECGCNSWELESRKICSKCGKLKTVGSSEGICECGGNWLRKPMTLNPIRKTGLICPSCDNLIWPYQNKYDPDDEDFCPLMPEDFANQTQRNSKCYVCGESLWEPKVYNIGPEKKLKWKVMKQYTNAKKKNTSTVWVMDGREKEYEEFSERELLEEVPPVKSRKVSPASYIKKQLKGYFDYAIFDECHLYKGGATAQGNAMAALVSASKKQLLLTGTLLNGYASAIFYLLFRVAPHVMKEHGFSWEDELEFAKRYGVVKTTYSFDSSGAIYNKTSRGKQISSPKVKPGISPMIIVDMLLPYQLTLDLSDMSKFLPPLKEMVVPVEPDGEMLTSYRRVISTLNQAKYTISGSKCDADKLQFSLSYPDKPYNREPIISSVDGSTLAVPQDNGFLIENGGLLSKEKKLIEIVKSELSENRNSVIFAEYTNSAETIITTRLKAVLEENIPELMGKVCIIESGKPKASERESYMHEKARQGVRVFITNPRCVETGLDFVWNETDSFGDVHKYNYPTLIFFQSGYNLFTLWQASRRHYRLCQTEECRTYYLAYKRTIQMDVLQVLAEKQTATAAIQGKFSAEGLAKMAQQVDARVKLAQSLADQTTEVDENALVNMFDAINNTNNEMTEHESEIMANYTPMQLFEEVLGALVVADDISDEIDKDLIGGETSDFADNFLTFFEMGTREGWFADKNSDNADTGFLIPKETGVKTKKNKTYSGQENLFDLLFS